LQASFLKALRALELGLSSRTAAWDPWPLHRFVAVSLEYERVAAKVAQTAPSASACWTHLTTHMRVACDNYFVTLVLLPTDVSFVVTVQERRPPIAGFAMTVATLSRSRSLQNASSARTAPTSPTQTIATSRANPAIDLASTGSSEVLVDCFNPRKAE